MPSQHSSFSLRDQSSDDRLILDSSNDLVIDSNVTSIVPDDNVYHIDNGDSLSFPDAFATYINGEMAEGLGERKFKSKKKKQSNTRCYSARTGLKRLLGKDTSNIDSLAKNNYNGCRHCGWYSMLFYKNKIDDCEIIRNNMDFLKVQRQFVNHFNRSHKDICEKKLRNCVNQINKHRWK